MAKSERTNPWTSPFFGNLVADRVRFALTRYFSRKAQVADIIYNDAILETGFPVPRDFALAFLGDTPLKPGDSRKIKLKMDGKRYNVLFQRPGPAREYRIVYDAKSEPAHALREYLGDNLKSGDMAFTLRASGKSELIAEKLGG
jgi:hypothetical protein